MSLSSVVAECEAAVAELQRPAAIRVCAWQDAADFRMSYGSSRHISPYGLALLTLPEACPLSSPLSSWNPNRTQWARYEGSRVEDQPGICKMSSTGTMRGTPKRPQSNLSSQFNDSPSNIPRPKLESAISESGGHSTLSASRAKQSKRDEV